MQFDKSKTEHGFTLIELAVVLAIGGFLLVGVTKLAFNYLENTRYEENERKMEKITKALQQFLDINQRLPCPASLTAAPDTGTFGIESSANCTTDVTGTYLVNGPGSKRVRIGALPVRSLNIDDEMMLDGWNRRFVYAVTRELAQDGNFDPHEGAIGINDSEDNPVFMPEESLQYIIISHGSNGIGAYTRQGKLYKNCDTSTVEGPNCAHDENIFSTTIKRSNNDDSTFDDFVRYDLLTVHKADTFTLPEDSVVAFDLDDCPAGWSLMPELAGRAVVGMGLLRRGELDMISYHSLRQQEGFASIRMDPGTLFYSAENRHHRHPLLTRNVTNIQTTNSGGFPVYVANPNGGNYPFTTNSTGGDGSLLAARQENRQPYRVYTYCKKN